MGKTESKRGNGTAPTRLAVQRTMDAACTRKLQAYKVFAPVNTPPVFGPVVLSLESSPRRCPRRQGHGGVVFLDILFNDECFCIVFLSFYKSALWPPLGLSTCSSSTGDPNRTGRC